MPLAVGGNTATTDIAAATTKFVDLQPAKGRQLTGHGKGSPVAAAAVVRRDNVVVI